MVIHVPTTSLYQFQASGLMGCGGRGGWGQHERESEKRDCRSSSARPPRPRCRARATSTGRTSRPDPCRTCVPTNKDHPAGEYGQEAKVLLCCARHISSDRYALHQRADGGRSRVKLSHLIARASRWVVVVENYGPFALTRRSGALERSSRED